MVKFILKRIGTMIIAMFMIILITFTLMHSIPGGPFTNTKGVPEEVTQAMEAKYGLDQPMPVQFVKYLGNLLHGDFGPSYKYTGKTVNDFIATGAPVSAKLGLVTLVFVLLTSIPMGILAALKNGKWQDMLLMAIATSIDALAVGVTFAFLETPILSAVGIIGVTTFCISVAGVAVGCWFGARYKQRAEITGGVILVLLGCKILLEHLGLLSF